MSICVGIRKLIFTICFLFFLVSCNEANAYNMVDGTIYSTFIDNNGINTILWSSPYSECALQLGEYMDGTQVVVLDVGNMGYVHIRIGENIEGYVAEETLSDIQIPLNSDGTMREIGYIVYQARDLSTSANNWYRTPSVASETVVNANGELESGTALLLGDCGEWYQTRGPLGESEVGFVCAVNRDKYLLADLIVDGESIVKQTDRFIVGVDEPCGLYTFISRGVDAGILEINTPDEARLSTIRVSGSYTVLLREGQQVITSSELVYFPMTIDNSYNTSLSGDGQFFIGGEIKGNEIYVIASMDGISAGCYRLHNLSNMSSEWFEVLPGEPVEMLLYSGEFIEIINCSIEKLNSQG